MSRPLPGVGLGRSPPSLGEPLCRTPPPGDPPDIAGEVMLFVPGDARAVGGNAPPGRTPLTSRNPWGSPAPVPLDVERSCSTRVQRDLPGSSVPVLGTCRPIGVCVPLHPHPSLLLQLFPVRNLRISAHPCLPRAGQPGGTAMLPTSML